MRFTGPNGKTCCRTDNPDHLCDKCKARYANGDRGDESDLSVDVTLAAYAPPDPLWEAEIAKHRAALATPMSRFEEQFAADRLRELDKEYAATDKLRTAERAAPRITAAELARYESPDAYGPALRALKEKSR